MLENPTTKFFKKNKKLPHTPHPTVSFPMFTVKKGINPSDSRRGGVGQGEKLMDFRQGGRRKAEKHVMVSWLRGERREKEQRRGAIKTLTSNLVYCVKKSHMHSRPPEGPHCSLCGHGGH